MSVLDIVRPEIRALKPYRAAIQADHFIRLNANESSWSASDAEALNRYPEIRPAGLRATLAGHYGVETSSLLVTRGSSEAIDIILRAFCRPGVDEIVIPAPTFGMYRVYADVQGAGVRTVTSPPERDYAIEVDRLLGACGDNSKIIFVCSPNNPTGRSVDIDEIRALLESRHGQSVVVVDEAYIEFSDLDSACSLVEAFDNLIVLRTTSKAMALAGTRCGCAIASPDIIEILDRVLPPYSMPTPVSAQVVAAFSEERIALNRTQILNTVARRQQLHEQLNSMQIVERVVPSDANFLLVRFADAKTVFAACMDAEILVRDLSDISGLDNCLRISVGSSAEIELLLAALRSLEQRRVR